MPFAFDRGEPVDVGARRLALQGCELVLGAMHGTVHGSHPDAAVHEARRTLKRLRALVRLIAPMIGEQAREANVRLRDAARDFAGSRDAAVMLATFDAITGDAIAGPDPAAARVRRNLLRRKRSAHPNDSDAEVQLRAFAASIESWSFDGAWSSIEPGLRRTYRNGKRSLASVLTEELELHELRKRCKDLQFQLTLTRLSFPQVIGGYLEALRDLGSKLGEEHDLLILGEALARQRVDVTPWLTRIAERRSALRAEILPLAARIYVDSAREWTDRLGRWWSL